MITEVYAYEQAPSSYQAALFLAGPTPRGPDVASWRPEALALLHKLELTIDLVVFIPEPRDGHDYSDYVQQVTWEQQHLEMADAILVWLPRDMKTSLKGLTTNVEFGKYIDSGKLFYGRPEHAEHIHYLDWLYTDTTARPPQTQLKALIAEILTYLTTQLESSPVKTRRAGERFVPLMIWRSTLFQAWYQRQQQAGNQLLTAKLLWIFILKNKRNYTFAYALHVDVWIAAEDRVKSNEFIISRPDISVVIPYWKHPTNIMNSEVVLIREFRAPGRTADGFVYELPGGSTFSDQDDPLKLASCELKEETGLRLEAHRFRYLGSKQLAATWSTHHAALYAVDLEEHEIEYAKKYLVDGSHGVESDTEKTYVHVLTLAELSDYVDWAMEGMIYHAIIKA